MKKLITDSIMPGTDGALKIFFNKEFLGSVEIKNKKEKTPVKTLLLNFLTKDIENMDLTERTFLLENSPLSMFMAVLSVKTTKKILIEACKGFEFEFGDIEYQGEVLNASE